jgi:hypothetical protein
MPIITHDRPDPKYYRNIIQYDDGNWAADPLPVDDTIVYPVKGGYGSVGLPQPGLRTTISKPVATIAMQLINKYAPNDLQRNALYVLATQTSGTVWTNAKAMMDWIVAVNAFRDAEIARVKALNFNELVAYLPPVGVFPPWPAPPSGLTPVASVRVGSAAHKLRFS